MKNKFLILFSLILCNYIIKAQTKNKYITGKIYTEERNVLTGANIVWQNTNVGCISDSTGFFKILKLNSTDSPNLLISFIGFKDYIIKFDDVLDYQDVILKKSIQLKNIDINQKVNTTEISLLNPIQVENISSDELCKTACCNLAESFETNASIDVSYSEAVTGNRNITMLGLDGDYLQITKENVPLIRGLSSSYGLNLVPGPWIESMQLSKGVGSVLNGFESTTGQLNINLYNPENSPDFFLNGFFSLSGKEELNLIMPLYKKKWLSSILFHASNYTSRNDKNNDGFLDMPIGNQLNLLKRWQYIANDDLYLTLSVNAISDNKEAGSNDFNVNIQNKLLDIFNKTGWNGFSDPEKSMALQTNFKFYEINSNFGDKFFNAKQNSIYLNYIYQSYLINTNNTYRTGLTYYLDDFNKQGILDTNFIDMYSGLYLEYNYLGSENFEILMGLRADYLNKYGFFYTPKFQIRINPIDEMVVRLSAGSGFRKINPVSDNINILSSNRNININESLNPEIANNFGINIAREFKLFNRPAKINSDFYYVIFQNKVVVDFETQNQVYFRNSKSSSNSKVFQFDFNYELIDRLDIKSSYKIQNVYSIFDSQKMLVPFVPKNRFFFNLSYETLNEMWKLDLTFQRTGKSRVPFHSDLINNSQIILENNQLFNLPFNIIHSQITHLFSDFQIYLGCENMLNYTQENPILNDPDNQDFDASLIWAPTMGRKVYLGFRYNFNN